MDLFEYSNKQVGVPLAEVMRPSSWDDFVGQCKYVKKVIDRFLKTGHIPNLLIWGPPGCGKTSFANLLAAQTNFRFIPLNASLVTGKGVLQECDQARQQRLAMGKQTILFVDEVHRLKRNDQEILLAPLEKGDVIFVGATTENPGYRMSPALQSRCQILLFEKLSSEHLKQLLMRILALRGQTMAKLLTEEAVFELLRRADGDARAMINFIEQILWLSEFGEHAGWPLSLENLNEVLLGKAVRPHDASGESHYDTISALIKSIRGSDPDASVYYLARLIDGGEDPLFIARRLIILASEDIGNADPQALNLATACFQALEIIGMPEGRFALAQVVLYLASTDKSDSAGMALSQAQHQIEHTGRLPIPNSLRGAGSEAIERLGIGKGYLDPHKVGNLNDQQVYLPERLKGSCFYQPKAQGYEGRFAKKLNRPNNSG